MLFSRSRKRTRLSFDTHSFPLSSALDLDIHVVLNPLSTIEFVAVDLRSFLSNQRHATSTMCRLLCGLALWTNVHRMSEVSSSQDGLFVRQRERLGLVGLAIGTKTRTHQIDWFLVSKTTVFQIKRL